MSLQIQLNSPPAQKPGFTNVAHLYPGDRGCEQHDSAKGGCIARWYELGYTKGKEGQSPQVILPTTHSSLEHLLEFYEVLWSVCVPPSQIPVKNLMLEVIVLGGGGPWGVIGSQEQNLQKWD